MRILEYGDANKPKIMLIHGFLSPYKIWNNYIEYYKDKYHILVPILPGHDEIEKSEFTSFNDVSKEIENYCLSKSITSIYAIYGMSMGGIVASHLWKNNNLNAEKIILESSPLLSFNKLTTFVLTREYLSMIEKARKRDKKVVQNAVNSMITEELLDDFLKLLDNISDETIKKYLYEVGTFKLSLDINTPNTQVIYFYGDKLSELVFKKVAKHIKKNYKNSVTICIKGKGHCEDSLINSKEWCKTLDKYIN